LKKFLKNKCKKIKLVLTDVDGVLTDGGRYYSEKGEIMKKFHVKDGMGINILLRNGISTVIVTKENSKIVKKWAKEMNVSKTYSGIKIKEKELEKICKLYKILPDEVAFIGDDVNDIELMKKVGFSVTPSDGILQAKKIANYVCTTSGGNGALREMIDLILKEKFADKTNFY
jgi:YrbI family 3-deoxy-D-manno-octulosonate 8-phosphate phosphatase|tara:strand:+ start:316 stop:831 length:516 start_codon:yes stop_codon:yes gene_type:complete